MTQQIIKELESRLAKTLEVLKKDLATVRTGRARTSLVEEVKVEAYGGVMSMKEVATITVPDPSLIVISPWDKSLVAAVSGAIQKAELNINPVVDGDTIKLSIPPLTQERREEMVKMVSQKLESGRVMMRQVRGEIKDEIEKQEEMPGVSEDDIKSWLDQMQSKVDEYMEKITELGKSKEEELMTI